MKMTVSVILSFLFTSAHAASLSTAKDFLAQHPASYQWKVVYSDAQHVNDEILDCREASLAKDMRFNPSYPDTGVLELMTKDPSTGRILVNASIKLTIANNQKADLTALGFYWISPDLNGQVFGTGLQAMSDLSGRLSVGGGAFQNGSIQTADGDSFSMTHYFAEFTLNPVVHCPNLPSGAFH